MTILEQPYTTIHCSNPACSACLVIATRLARDLGGGQARAALAFFGWRLDRDSSDPRGRPVCGRCAD